MSSKYLSEQEKRGPTNVEPSIKKVTEFGIRDTEFLIRLIMSSKIDGGDLEVAAAVSKKIKELHASIISHTVRV
jgi:hypothetical protein